MGLFQREPKQDPEAAALVKALSHVSHHILNNAEAHAWHEHEAGRLTSDAYFVVMRRLRLLAGYPEGIEPETRTTT